jgi:hypothetical protein
MFDDASDADVTPPVQDLKDVTGSHSLDAEGVVRFLALDDERITHIRQVGIEEHAVHGRWLAAAMAGSRTDGPGLPVPAGHGDGWTEHRTQEDRP